VTSLGNNDHAEKVHRYWRVIIATIVGRACQVGHFHAPTPKTNEIDRYNHLLTGFLAPGSYMPTAAYRSNTVLPQEGSHRAKHALLASEHHIRDNRN
jgi:hypothetical protein